MNEKCPYCNEKMELGYIQCRDGVTWTKKLQPLSALSFLSPSAINLASERKPLDGAYAEAYHCRSCKKIVIGYGPAPEESRQ